MIWTEDQLDALRRMHADGHSAGSIALEIGVTRGSISGMARRIGIFKWRSTKRAWYPPPGKLTSVPHEERRRLKALEPPPVPTPRQERDKRLEAIPPALRHLRPAPARAMSKDD